MPKMRIFNTLTGREEEFSPLRPPLVTMYVCGPTVYDLPHMGHARVAVFFDVVRRWLTRRGFSVRMVMNVTDVEDKIINRARELGVPWSAVARHYEAAFWEDMLRLGVSPPDIAPRASEHIPEMVEAIGSLVEKGHAYFAGDGVYFHVPTFPGYGKLSKIRREELVAGARVEPGEGKRDPADFALWKCREEEPSWDSLWCRGRPGWHIECSVMSMKYLGETIDIHGGGADLIFPHHENEIAQSEALTGRPFVRYWMHVGLVRLKGEKMSKSTGLLFTVREALKRYSPEAVRHALLNTHYRKPLEFDEALLEEGSSAVRELSAAHRELLEAAAPGPAPPWVEGEVERRLRAFASAMDSDFNTHLAIGEMRSLAEAAFRDPGPGGASLILLALWEMDSVLGLVPRADPRTERLVEGLLAWRAEERSRRNFPLADRIRGLLRSSGFEVEDRAGGYRWSLR